MGKSLEEMKEIRNKFIGDYGNRPGYYNVSILTRFQVSRLSGILNVDTTKEEDSPVLMVHRSLKYPHVPDSEKEDYCLMFLYDKDKSISPPLDIPSEYHGVRVFMRAGKLTKKG